MIRDPVNHANPLIEPDLIALHAIAGGTAIRTVVLDDDAILRIARDDVAGIRGLAADDSAGPSSISTPSPTFARGWVPRIRIARPARPTWVPISLFETIFPLAEAPRMWTPFS